MINVSILRTRDIIAMLKFSNTTIWRKIKDGTFPKPIKLGTKALGWFESDILDWINARKREAQQIS